MHYVLIFISLKIFPNFYFDVFFDPLVVEECIVKFLCVPEQSSFFSVISDIHSTVIRKDVSMSLMYVLRLALGTNM
jgi:hypothetical protein